ncbi:prephenate dehydratase [Anaerobiospirillum succiniciproducens]|uniref:prephenate dehydratase n=1 Tax=Anaerobiospirillum succiniciproducens TaxID=13335 RepID=UPI0023542E2C|nr:prephenate dehydratase [Anaerobiospirillum succiniciproducens]MCI6862998.1 prephenate dehydratase [Anaerobiospirillum succiniciproducens]
MRDLLDCRDAIDEIDSKIIKLLQERQAVATDVAIYKLHHDQRIVDKQREAQKIATLMDKATQSGISPVMIREIYEKIMAHTVSYEQSYIVDKINGKDITRSTSVAYLGTKGTYSHLATQHYFANYSSRMEEHSCSSFDEIVYKVESGACEYGVLPIENSNSGSINEAVDTMQSMNAFITGEIFYPIDHSLLSVVPPPNGENDAFDFKTIKTIYSHPQPVAQCSKFIKEHLSHANIVYTDSSSEAMSIVKQQNDPSAVALGSKHAACYYSLNSLMSDIANNKNNYTRFIILSKTPVDIPSTMAAKTSILFSTKKYTPGSLIAVLNEFNNAKINLTKLYSRPLEAKNRDAWEEIFFADVEANLNTTAMQNIMQKLKYLTGNLKVLGCYLSAEHKQI